MRAMPPFHPRTKFWPHGSGSKTPAFSAGSQPDDASLGTESLQTRRWRELDSKFQFRATLGGLAGLRDPQSGQRRRVASELVSTHCRREVDLPSVRRMPSRLSQPLDEIGGAGEQQIAGRELALEAAIAKLDKFH